MLNRWTAARKALVFGLQGVFAVLLFGCVNPFAPRLDKGEESSQVVTEQRTPDEVLQNFKIAYTFKDSLLYSDVLDSSFVFEFYDPDLEPSGGFVTWGRDVDLQTTGRLFRSFQTIDLVWVSTVYEFREGDTEKIFRRFNLNLVGDQFVFTVTGTAIFSLRQSQHDGKWRIVHWKDESDL